MRNLSLIGTKLADRYEIIGKLGGGGMALVYKAKDNLLNRIVTVKVLRDEYADDQEFVSRFRHEAQAVASLSHPNIVNIFDVGYYQGNHYLVMEFIEGENLKEIIKKKAPLSVEEAIKITKQICDGLEHAHENKIIHRDIKPHNILITKNGKIKVADFGLARAVSTATVTHTKTVMGSVHYFSPEQAKGHITDEKSDIYSLGIVLYEMLTGQVPFAGGESPISVALKHIESEPESLTKLNPAVPMWLEMIVKKAMAKEIGNRYKNIGELKTDLETLQTTGKLNNHLHETELEKTREIPSVEKAINANISKEKKTKKIRPLAVGIGVIILLALAITTMIAFQKIWFVAEVEVPDVEGMTLFEASQSLKQKGLEMEIAMRRHDNHVDIDRIISQSPKAGATVKKNRSIAVDVSKGPVLKEVPDVVGKTKLEAEIELQNKGFLPEVELEYNDLVPEGKVSKQLPRANSQEPEGSVVLLSISRGAQPRYIDMPDLVGRDLEEAKDILDKNRLDLAAVSYVSSTEFFEGTVIKQDVEGQSLVLQGEAVNLVISSGPGPAVKTYDVDIPVPQREEEAVVKIVVEDAKGHRIAYQVTHRGGEIVSTKVDFYGEGTMEIFINDKLIKSKKLP